VDTIGNGPELKKSRGIKPMAVRMDKQ